MLCGPLQTAVTAESWVAVRQTNAHYWLYTLSEIERVMYVEDDLYVITPDGTDAYPLDAIVRIDFIPDTATVGVDGPGDRPASLDPIHLFQNTPNPFTPDTRIAFELPVAGRAELKVFDVSGRLIRTLVNEKRPAGPHSVRWDGCDDTGAAVASGVYFYTLTAPGVDENRRMILVK